GIEHWSISLLLQELAYRTQAVALARGLRTVPHIPGRLDSLLWIDTFVHRDREERREHLLPSHVAEINGSIWVRIELVVRRIVIVRGDDHPGALRYLYRFSEIVAELPIEIVSGNA